MNRAHIEAILKYSDSRYTFTLPDGSSLWTNGHIALKGDFSLEGAKDYPQLGKLWAEAAAIKPVATPIGKICFYDNRYHQHLQLNSVVAAYFRCFDGPDIIWTETAKEQMVYAHRGPELIGIVMPVRHDEDHCATVPSVADAEVFEVFACEANDYYLVDSKPLRREIDKLVADFETAEEAAQQANDKVARLESQIAATKRRLEAIKAKRIAEALQRQTDIPPASAGGKA